MTIKEKLCKQYIIAWNKVYRLIEKDLFNESEEYFASNEFKLFAKQHTKAELQDSIDVAVRTYEEEVEKLRIENYFNTEDGKARKEELEKAIEDLQNKADSFKGNMQTEMNAIIKEWLGDLWGVNMYNGSMEIGVIKGVHENGWFNFHFGRDFDIYFSDYVTENGKFRFDMNYGTTGSFNPFEDDVHREFVIGMGKFLGDTEKLLYIKKKVHEYVYHLQKLSDNIYDLRNELKNPFKYKKVV